MKSLLKAYEQLSIVFMLGFIVIFLMGLYEGAMNVAIPMMLISMFFMLIVSWTNGSTYINWKNNKGYNN